MYTHKFLILNRSLDDKRLAEVKQATLDVTSWLAKITDEIKVEFFFEDSLIPLTAITGTVLIGIDLGSTKNYFVDPILLSEEGRKAEIKNNKDFNVTCLIYPREMLSTPVGTATYPLHNPQIFYGFTTIQIPLLPASEQMSVSESLCHEMLHGWYFLAGQRDRVHELSGMFDPRPLANYSVAVMELEPYFGLIASTVKTTEPEVVKPTASDKAGQILGKNRPQYLIIHHTLTDRDTTTFEAVDRYHKSLGWGGIGYHYFIDGKGVIRQGRKDSAVGAHTKQESMNYKSLGICLAGNFDKEVPSDAQIIALKTLLTAKSHEYSIPVSNIYPHRHFATYKSCYGGKLTDDWARKLLIKKTMQVIKVDGDFYAIGSDSRRHLIVNWATFRWGESIGLWGDLGTVKEDKDLAKLPLGYIIAILENN